MDDEEHTSTTTTTEIHATTTIADQEEDRGGFVLILVSSIAAILLLAMGLGVCWFYWSKRAKGREKAAKEAAAYAAANKKVTKRHSSTRKPISKPSGQKKSLKQGTSQPGPTTHVKMIDELRKSQSDSGREDELKSETMEEMSTSVTSSSTQLTDDSVDDNEQPMVSQGSSVASLVESKTGDHESILALPVLVRKQPSITSFDNAGSTSKIKLPSGTLATMKPAHPAFGRMEQSKMNTGEGNKREVIPISVEDIKEFPESIPVKLKQADQLYSTGYGSNFSSPDFKINEQFTVRQTNAPPVPPKPNSGLDKQKKPSENQKVDKQLPQKASL